MTSAQPAQSPPMQTRLTLYFVRAQFALTRPNTLGPTEGGDADRLQGLDVPSSRLGRAVIAAAQRYEPRALRACHLPLSQLVVQREAGVLLDEAFAAKANDPRPGPTQPAYLFTSANAVRALEDLGRLDQLDRTAALFCVGSRVLAALRAHGFDGPTTQAPTAAALENAIIEGPLRTLGCGAPGDEARAPDIGRVHYFCATKVSHAFQALDSHLQARCGRGLEKHPLYAAEALPDSDKRLVAALEQIKAAPEQALMLVYSRALARRLGGWLQSAAQKEAKREAHTVPASEPLSDWRARLPVLCLSPAIAVELEAWDLRTISVAQTPDEEGLAAALCALVPGLALTLDPA